MNNFKNKGQLYRFVSDFMERKELVEELSSLLPLDEVEFSKVNYMLDRYGIGNILLTAKTFPGVCQQIGFQLVSV